MADIHHEIDPRDPYAKVAEQQVLRLLAAFHGGDASVYSDELSRVMNETIDDVDGQYERFAHLLLAFVVSGGATLSLVALTYQGEVSYETSYANALHAIDQAFDEQRRLADERDANT